MQVLTAYSFLVETAWKSTAILAAAWLVVWMLRARSAAVRHLVWTVAFAGVLVLPMLSLALPSLGVPVEDSRAVPGLLFSAGTTDRIQRRAEQTDRAGNVGPAAMPWVSDWRLLLMLVWGAGVALSFAQMLIGYMVLERIRRKAKVLAGQEELAPLARLLKVPGGVELRETAAGSMPITYGLWRSSLFMPADAKGWSAERRRIVLLHELAHVRRGDSATHLLGRVAVSLYWWNPLAWAAWREFLKERERAADDLVLAAGPGGTEYAGHLFEIARSMQRRTTLGWTAVAMASRSQLEGRMLAILEADRDRRTPRRASAVAAVVAAFALIAPLAALRAEAGSKQDTTGQTGSNGPLAAGDQARETGKYEQAKSAYKKVLKTSGSGPEAATAYLHRGTVEMATHEYPAAIHDFEQAQLADSSRSAEALMWMAIAQHHQQDLGGAAALYQRALGAADPESAIAATIREMFAGVLEQQALPDEAKEMRRQAVASRNNQMVRARQVNHTPADVYRAGRDVKSPMLKSKVEPAYTEEARLAKYSGTALLGVIVGEDGMTHDIRVIRGLGFGLDEKAVEAVRQWTFAPGSKDGQPVRVAATIEVSFRLL